MTHCGGSKDLEDADQVVLGSAVSLEQLVQSEHLKQDHTHSPHVSAEVVVVEFQDLFWG